MNEQPANNLTEGWPPDPHNEDLARFAGELHAALPEMALGSLANVEQRLHEELTRQRRRGRLARLALAASVLLALGIGGYAWLRPTTAERQPRPVDERFTVELAAPQTPLPSQPPLVRLEEHQSLFAD
ncbi:MAG TPA: hypothetical protein VEL76_08970 [Gemmataceae bacterium]|nr:hypothetical protein [Gemmataceae bacterium]